jgi:hypothetical protein
MQGTSAAALLHVNECIETVGASGCPCLPAVEMEGGIDG